MKTQLLILSSSLALLVGCSSWNGKQASAGDPDYNTVYSPPGTPMHDASGANINAGLADGPLGLSGTATSSGTILAPLPSQSTAPTTSVRVHQGTSYDAPATSSFGAGTSSGASVSEPAPVDVKNRNPADPISYPPATGNDGNSKVLNPPSTSTGTDK